MIDTRNTPLNPMMQKSLQNQSDYPSSITRDRLFGLSPTGLGNRLLAEINSGGNDMGSKGRKNVKKPKKQALEKKAQKAEQKKK